ncbi:hypothetical protein [Bifidobacterium bombi]|uniref:hypothetical protein n=1 Tax=Bifidobacterium bombi TaxID=471511 RepID=UPI001EE64668|nr:hypothetical protein [Bifidobacterium bombi]
MMTSTQMTQADSATTMLLVVSEKVTARMAGTMMPMMSAPRLSLGYRLAKREVRATMALPVFILVSQGCQSLGEREFVADLPDGFTYDHVTGGDFMGEETVQVV